MKLSDEIKFLLKNTVNVPVNIELNENLERSIVHTGEYERIKTYTHDVVVLVANEKLSFQVSKAERWGESEDILGLPDSKIESFDRFSANFDGDICNVGSSFISDASEVEKEIGKSDFTLMNGKSPLISNVSGGYVELSVPESSSDKKRLMISCYLAAYSDPFCYMNSDQFDGWSQPDLLDDDGRSGLVRNEVGYNASAVFRLDTNSINHLGEHISAFNPNIDLDSLIHLIEARDNILAGGNEVELQCHGVSAGVFRQIVKLTDRVLKLPSSICYSQKIQESYSSKLVDVFTEMSDRGRGNFINHCMGLDNIDLLRFIDRSYDKLKNRSFSHSDNSI